MIGRDEALRIGESALRELEAAGDRPLALWPDEPGTQTIVDHGDVWTINWNAVEYFERRDPLVRALVGPIVVPKDGSDWFVLGTSAPAAEQLVEWRRTRGSSGRPARYFRVERRAADGSTVLRGLYRREGDDVTGDAVIRADREWHFTSQLDMALKGFDDTDFREVDRAAAEAALEEMFGDATLLDKPTVRGTAAS